MAFRERVLPEWLSNLDSGNTPSKKKTNCNKSRGNKKHVNACDGNDNYSSLNESDGKNLPSTSGRKSTNLGNSVMANEQSSAKLSPRKQVSRAPKAHPEMSSSDEEAEVKPDLSSLKETILSADSSVDSHAAHVPVIKKEDEGSEAKEIFDPNIKREGIEEPLGNEPEIKGAESDDSDKTDIENYAGNVPDVISDSGGATGSNADAGSGVDNLAGVNVDCDVSTSVDATTVVNGSNGDQFQSVSSTTNNSINSDRPKCKYGTQCYRKNPQHLQDFSHPGDTDYSTLDNRPECQYGLACYRKNPLHRQHYKHTKKVQKPRQAKRPRQRLVDDSASDDEYDLDDPFIDDGSSDDYAPSDSDSETDFDDAEEAESGNGDNNDDNAKQNVKTPKKLKRKHRH